MRQVLMGNVVLAGGGSLFAGFGERLSNELVRNFPHIKIHAPGNPAERRYGSWLGGSILASLGTFHQLWISREEWQEHGKPILLSGVNRLFQLFVHLTPPVSCRIRQRSSVKLRPVENKEHQHVPVTFSN